MIRRQPSGPGSAIGTSVAPNMAPEQARGTARVSLHRRATRCEEKAIEK
jgi:hypothetical protein